MTISSSLPGNVFKHAESHQDGKQQAQTDRPSVQRNSVAPVFPPAVFLTHMKPPVELHVFAKWPLLLPQKQKTRAPSGERVLENAGNLIYEKTLARPCRGMQQQQQLPLMATRIWQSFCIRPAVLQNGAKVVNTRAPGPSDRAG
jgi:hypothetical protein